MNSESKYHEKFTKEIFNAQALATSSPKSKLVNSLNDTHLTPAKSDEENSPSFRDVSIKKSSINLNLGHSKANFGYLTNDSLIQRKTKVNFHSIDSLVGLNEPGQSDSGYSSYSKSPSDCHFNATRIQTYSANHSITSISKILNNLNSKREKISESLNVNLFKFRIFFISLI